jgi:hypothetical protein
MEPFRLSYEKVISSIESLDEDGLTSNQKRQDDHRKSVTRDVPRLQLTLPLRQLAVIILRRPVLSHLY